MMLAACRYNLDYARSIIEACQRSPAAMKSAMPMLPSSPASCPTASNFGGRPSKPERGNGRREGRWSTLCRPDTGGGKDLPLAEASVLLAG